MLFFEHVLYLSGSRRLTETLKVVYMLNDVVFSFLVQNLGFCSLFVVVFNLGSIFKFESKFWVQQHFRRQINLGIVSHCDNPFGEV